MNGRMLSPRPSAARRWLGPVAAAALLWAAWASASWAAIIINDSLPITHRVTVQIIETARDNGSSPATIFGTASQRAAIESMIDTIWSQAGIDVAFLPNIVRYNDTFAYEGNRDPRPQSDLSMIINQARSEGGILNPDTLVINMFFVNVVPGYEYLNEDTSGGVAKIYDNGIAMFVGDNLLTFNGGREVIAGVVAHEIGHNLGLFHTGNNEPNLMSPGGTAERLTTSQIDVALSGTEFARPLPTALPGDYNGDGRVDAADYTVWRDTLGTVGAGMAADGNGNGRIDSGDYTVWTSNFGETGDPGGAGSISSPYAVATPEPGTQGLVLIAAVLLAHGDNSRRRV